MRKIIIFACSFISISGIGQVSRYDQPASYQPVVIYNTGGLPILYSNKENSAETAQKYKNAEINLEKAYEAYETGDLEKTKYYLYLNTKILLINFV